MAEEKVEVRDINFRQVLPWTELFRGFQVALDPKKLVLAAAGILFMAVGWWLLGLIFYTQPRPKWEEFQSQYPAEKREEAYKQFKDDRLKWDILHGAAGNDVVYTDAGDLAPTPKDYDAIKKDIDEANQELKKSGAMERDVLLNGVTYHVVAKPYGSLRTWPWFEDRGPNPYLLLTGQTGRPWDTGHFGEWVVFGEGRVLLEPLVKFLYPVVYLLHPKTGTLNRVYFLLVTLWTLAVWALFGGAITRMASVQVARNDKVGLTESLRFVMSRYLSFLSAPIFPLLFIVFMVVLLIIYGWLFMIPVVGDIIVAGLGWPLVLLAGVAMAVVLVGLVGWPMMYATISAEGSDSFDAISRSYSYVYQNPWHYIWYGVVSLAYGAVVVFFIGFMGSAVVYLGKWGVTQTPGIEMANRDPAFLFVWAPTSFGWRTLLLQGSTVDGQPLVVDGKINAEAYDKLTGEDKVHGMSWWNWIGCAMVTVWLYGFFLLVLGFAYSYFWSSSTIIYLLMRRKVDDTDLDEVYLEEDEAEDTYSSSTTLSAPASPPAPSSTPLQMVDAPTLRTPVASSPPAADAPAPAGTPPPGDGTQT